MQTLTGRELSILKILARGQTNAEIAGALGIAEKTVKNVNRTIFLKMGARNRVEAALIFHKIPLQS